MKKILVLIFLLISSLGFGQQVNAPDPKEFLQSTSGQDASGFSLSGFNSTATLLCAVGLPNTVAGTTFYFTTTSGVTASTGYSMGGNKTRISFTGTQANINTVLASMKINTPSTKADINISVSATVNPTGYFYLPTNGHFYRPMSGFSGVTAFSGTSPTAYNNLKTYCTQQSFKGQTGYLMTITSSDEDNFVVNNVPGNNIIFALTDNETEGRFVIDAGPENGTVVRINSTNQQGQYNNWAGGEPNNWGPGEDYVVTKWNGSQWNDFGPEATAFPGGLGGYVIEFGTWSNPDDQTFTDFYNNAVTHSNGPDLSLKALFQFNFGSNVNESNFATKLFKRNDATSNWVSAGDYKALSGLGKVYLSNQLDTAKSYSSAISISPQNDMTQFSSSDIGKIYKMTITGVAGGAIWGTDIYTSDSYISGAAVHAGVITAGQTKDVFIKIVEGLNNYPGTTRNGVTTSGWGGWDLSYQFVNEPSSYKANTSPGQVEWCVIYDYDASNQRYRVGIDKREFTGTNVSSNSISKLKLFDLWDGNVTFKSDDGTWAEYWVYTPTQFNYAGSSYSSNLRAGNGFYGVSAEFTFAQNGAYKQHKLEFQQYDSVQLKTLYNSIVTVSDVWLAFKEVANVGIFGNQSGNEFGYGIQYKNGDVNDDGYFNEADAFRLLQNLTGVKDLINGYTLDNTMKIISDSTYGTIGKSNWSQFPSYLGKEYGFSLIDGKTNYIYDLAITWKGDVNLSHSATPPANGITNMSANFSEKVSSMSVSTNQMGAELISELSGDSVYVYITFKPGDNNIVGTQFQLNYDNSLLKFNKTEYITNGSPTNYSADKGTFINVGSLNTDGSQITSATYKVIFISKQKLNGVLGLISVGNSEVVSKDGKSLVVKIK